MKKFTVFGRAGCGFCDRAKQLLTSKQFPFRYVDILAEGISKADLSKTVGHEVTTVPQIFHGEEYVGGYTELESYIQNETI